MDSRFSSVRRFRAFDVASTYLCGLDGLDVSAGEAAETELTVHGDHFFYDDLADEGAQVRGEAIVEADSDGDGIVTLDERSAVGVAGLGYGVGPYSEVTDLAAFITILVEGLGHVDGEGHCQVNR